MPERRKSIFQFNHIDRSISQETLVEIRVFYSYYHKRAWVYKKAFKFYRRLNLISNITAVALVTTGAVVGSVTLNPIILSVISGMGILLKSYSEIKNFSSKIETSNFAFTTYEKSLIELRNSLRGGEFNNTNFINQMKLLDELIIDKCVIVDRFEKQYDKKFTTV